jgi:hypothetical protein
MTNQLNELHGRIQARQRNKARLGRHLFESARNAFAVGRASGETVGSNGQAQAHGITPDGISLHTITTADHSEAYLFKLFTAARAKALDVRLEGGPESARLEVLASDVDWASLKMAAYHDVIVEVEK